nr:retrovirus-related Pol polyprotein from transposon TNT 1-94 [Tanacetum cinerariifolium]
MLQRKRIKLFTSKENTLFSPHKRQRHRLSENQRSWQNELLKEKKMKTSCSWPLNKTSCSWPLKKTLGLWALKTCMMHQKTLEKRRRNYLGTHNTTNNMFRVKFSSKEHYGLMSSSKNNDSKVWHLRYGHLNVKGKQTRKQFPVGQSKRAKKKLELILANIYDPMKAQSLTGSNDFLLFIDDSTRMSGLYFLFHKSEALECFKKFKAFTEKQSGDSLKVLGSDSKEFYSLEFNDFGEA